MLGLSSRTEALGAKNLGRRASLDAMGRQAGVRARNRGQKGNNIEKDTDLTLATGANISSQKIAIRQHGRASFGKHSTLLFPLRGYHWIRQLRCLLPYRTC